MEITQNKTCTEWVIKVSDTTDIAALSKWTMESSDGTGISVSDFLSEIIELYEQEVAHNSKDGDSGGIELSEFLEEFSIT